MQTENSGDAALDLLTNESTRDALQSQISRSEEAQASLQALSNTPAKQALFDQSGETIKQKSASRATSGGFFPREMEEPEIILAISDLVL